MREYKLNLYGKEIIVNQDTDGYFIKPDFINEYEKYGTATKPAYEPIIVARKPFKTSVAENIMQYGVGGINIDECRISFGNESDSRVGTNIKRGESRKYKYTEIDNQIFDEWNKDFDFIWSEETKQWQDEAKLREWLDDYFMKDINIPFNFKDYENIIIDSDRKMVIPLLETFKPQLNSNSMFGVSDEGVQMYKENGRFPSNVIHDGSEEAIKDMPNTKGDNRESKSTYDKGIWGNAKAIESNALYNDSGSASRYFYCAKASKKDRDEGLDMFDSMQVNDGRNTPIDNAFQRGDTLRKNIHPTVKPAELMQYLVRLVTPKNGTILDCFMGSGSTGKAVMFENREREANYKFIGIELTEEYLPICEARIDYALNKYEYDFKKELEEAKSTGQQNIFDLIGSD